MSNIIYFEDLQKKKIDDMIKHIMPTLSNNIVTYIHTKIQFIMDTVWFGFDPEADKTEDEYLIYTAELAEECIKVVITEEIFGLISKYEFLDKLDADIKEFLLKKFPIPEESR